MITKLKLYSIIVLGAFSFTTGIALFTLWGWYGDVREELKDVNIARAKAEENLQLVSTQLEAEIDNRAAAEAALTALKDIDDVEYSTPLPPSIGNVLTDFRDRLQ